MRAIAATVAVLTLVTSAIGYQQASSPRSSQFEVMEQSITDLSDAMAAGRVTSERLVELSLARIEAYEHKGPRLNAMITVNPRAREQAAALDRERAAKGPRGPLHGIPVVVKDAFDTADMPTTGGAVGLAGSVPPDDAFQIRKLREAGAIILGKTNPHELGFGITNVSSVGGQTLNPYDPARNPGGSSGGTGAAVAASFAVAGLGTDACGSIRGPAAHNNLVGLRASFGLFSRDGIVPLSSKDVGGPIARSVRDLAIMLDAIAGPDPADPLTVQSAGKIAGSFVSRLDADGLRGARIGSLEPLFGNQPDDQAVARVVRDALADMEKNGAQVVRVDIPDFNGMREGVSLIQLDFKFVLDEYLKQTPKAPVRSMAELLDKGLHHVSLENNLRTAAGKSSRDTEEYRNVLAKREALRVRLLKAMDEQNLTAVAYPTLTRTAARIGDPQRGSNCNLSPATDTPAISVPAGFAADGMPVGIELLGRPFSDADLVKIAYAYEQATRQRRPPATTPSLNTPPAPTRFDVHSATTSDGSTNATRTVDGVFTYEARIRRLNYRVTTRGVTGIDLLLIDLHRGEEGKRGAVVLHLESDSATGAEGEVTLTPEQATDLTAGRLYLDVHTRRNVAGELRGQLQTRLPVR